jgi:hypothetical protein
VRKKSGTSVNGASSGCLIVSTGGSTRRAAVYVMRIIWRLGVAQPVVQFMITQVGALLTESKNTKIKPQDSQLIVPRGTSF